MAARKIAEARLPTKVGDFTLVPFESSDKEDTALALVMGTFDKSRKADPAPLVRIHSQCLTGDVFRSSRCDCGDQLAFAQEAIAKEGSGILIYHLQEGRGIGLMNKLLAYELQDAGGHDTVQANQHLGFPADIRNYDLCVDILKHFGVDRVRLLSNNPTKIEALENAGIAVVERIPIEIAPTDNTEAYLRTKKDKLGHLLSAV